MRLQRWYKVWDAALTPEACDRIVALGETLQTKPATVRRDLRDEVRSSSVGWIGRSEQTQWLFDAIGFYVTEANKALWRWKLTDVEALQYTLYGPGQFYKWHTDQREDPYPPDSRWPGLMRKVSVTVQLSEGDEYEGGEFELEEMRRSPERASLRVKTLVEARRRGTILVFPSFLYHRVAPVTSGTRRSLVAWYLGPPWV